MALSYTIERRPDQVTMVFAGEADSTVTDQFHAALFEVATEGYPQIVVDLRGLIFIDSTGIGILLVAHHAARHHGSAFRVAHPSGQVLRVLQITGVLGVLSATGSGDVASPGEHRANDRRDARSG
jgi:anti-sigma B factor antagonist